MSDVQKTKLGDAIFGSIDDNDFLNVLYDNMLYNYAILKLHLEGFQQARQVDVEAALRFADLLSKSTHPTKSDDHMWAASADPALAVSVRSTTTSLKAATRPNGPTAKSTPVMSTPIPARSARRS